MATRLDPTVSPDTEFFWTGLRNHELLIQRCGECGTLRNPPRPMCPHCQSLDWDTLKATGRGTVYSWVMPQYPPIPFMDYHYIVVLVALEEGIRLVSNLIDITPERVEVGMPVEVCFEEFDDALVLHQFQPAQ
jgi:uncharacterized OB-fold protein